MSHDTFKLRASKQHLEDNSQNVRENDWCLQPLNGLEQAYCLRLQWLFPGVTTHVAHVVQTVLSEESLTVKDRDSIGTEEARLF